MTTVLFVHGFPFDHLMWRHQIAALTRWHRLAPDLRGAGAAVTSLAVADYSMAAYADDLIALLDRSQVRQAVVCGLSMGGYIAFELLRRFPERVLAAILCNTKAEADTADGKRGRDALTARVQRDGATAAAAELVPKLLAPPTRERRPDVVREVQTMIDRQPVAGIVGALHALRERPDSTPLLAQINVPVLVLAGADDQIAPVGGMEAMAKAIPGAEFAVIREAGHLSPLEQPREVNAAVVTFLEKLR
ncbi:MAG TPA: alpha/beta fold hydrolase [Gemmatimonadales bacterium]|nr:alpha/beta fold hydrolase [Gemmatimonadales bacterium]